MFSVRFERTSLGYEQCVESNGEQTRCEGVTHTTFSDALEHMLALATRAHFINRRDEIDAVVVRVVVPGTLFQKHALLDEYYLHHLKSREDTAPLHVPHTLREIAVVKRLLPRAKLVAASDSAFHATMPDEARRYSIPEQEAQALDLYRFGYHGLSVASVIRRYHSVVGHDPQRVIVCHLGSGVSVTAVKEGTSVHTTMGYAPGTGLPMATRAGDLDTGALLALMRARGLRPLDALIYLSTRGGLIGHSGTDDLRLVIEAASRGEVSSVRAFDQYCFCVASAIAGATVSLKGCDAVVFTGTAGERSSVLRERLVTSLAHLGFQIDRDKNEAVCSRDAVISAAGSIPKLVVMRTDEMGEMYLVAQSFVAQLHG
jgi:acetate kinase